jgi:hypothetical protein
MLGIPGKFGRAAVSLLGIDCGGGGLWVPTPRCFLKSAQTIDFGPLAGEAIQRVRKLLKRNDLFEDKISLLVRFC